MTREEAAKAIAKKISQAEGLISDCEGLAEEHNLRFGLHIAYGMGGYYDGENNAWVSSSEDC